MNSTLILGPDLKKLDGESFLAPEKSRVYNQLHTQMLSLADFKFNISKENDDSILLHPISITLEDYRKMNFLCDFIQFYNVTNNSILTKLQIANQRFVERYKYSSELDFEAFILNFKIKAHLEECYDITSIMQLIMAEDTTDSLLNSRIKIFIESTLKLAIEKNPIQTSNFFSSLSFQNFHLNTIIHVYFVSWSYLSLLSKEEIKKPESFYCLIKKGLMSLDALTVKKSDYLLKNSIDRSKIDWINYFLVLDSLKEKQVHIVQPVLGKIDSLLSSSDVNSDWILLLYSMLFKHPSFRLKAWAIEDFLKKEPTLANEKFLDEFLLPSLNCAKLYVTVDNFENSLEYFFALKCSWKLSFNAFINLVSEEAPRWGPVPLFFVIKSFKKASSEWKVDLEGMKMMTFKIIDLVTRKFNCTDPSIKTALQKDLLEIIINVSISQNHPLFPCVCRSFDIDIFHLNHELWAKISECLVMSNYSESPESNALVLIFKSEESKLESDFLIPLLECLNRPYAHEELELRMETLIFAYLISKTTKKKNNNLFHSRLLKLIIKHNYSLVSVYIQYLKSKNNLKKPDLVNFLNIVGDSRTIFEVSLMGNSLEFQWIYRCLDIYSDKSNFSEFISEIINGNFCNYNYGYDGFIEELKWNALTKAIIHWPEDVLKSISMVLVRYAVEGISYSSPNKYVPLTLRYLIKFEKSLVEREFIPSFLSLIMEQGCIPKFVDSIEGILQLMLKSELDYYQLVNQLAEKATLIPEIGFLLLKYMFESNFSGYIPILLRLTVLDGDRRRSLSDDYVDYLNRERSVKFSLDELRMSACYYIKSLNGQNFSIFTNEFFKLLEPEFNLRYFDNSKVHLHKHRATQALLIGILYNDSITEDCAISVLEWSLKTLGVANQSSVKNLTEWIIIGLLKRKDYYPVLIKILDSAYLEAKKKKLGTIPSFLMIYSQVLDSREKAMGIISPWLMGRHFNTRLTAQILFKKIYENHESPPNKFIAIMNILKDAVNQGDEEENDSALKKDYFVNNFDFTRCKSEEAIFYDLPRLTGIVQDISVYYGSVQLHSSNPWSVHSNLEYCYCRDCRPGKSPFNKFEALNVDSTNIQTKVIPDIVEENRKPEYTELILITSLIKKLPNLGGLCRTSEVFGVGNMVVNSDKILKNSEFQSLSVTSHNWLPIQEVHENDLEAFLNKLRSEGYALVGIEQTSNSVHLYDYKFPKKCALILGNEKSGMPPNLIDACDVCVEIPQTGVVRSLNVHVTGAIVLYEYMRQRKIQVNSLID